MKRITFGIIAGLIWGTTGELVHAGLPPTTLSGLNGTKKTTFNFKTPLNQSTQVSGVDSLIETGNQNILKNPGFEGGTTDWTASGGSFSAPSSGFGTGTKMGQWDSDSSGQTLLSTRVNVPPTLQGNNGVVSCKFKCDSGTCTHKLTAVDVSTDLVTAQTISSSTSQFVRTSVNFPIPTSGSVGIKIQSVAGNEPQLYIDDCYMGPAEGFNISQVSQASMYGYAKWTDTGGCQWSASQGSFANFAADNDCTSPSGSNLAGNASAPTTKVPGISFATLPPGEYQIFAYGFFWKNNTTGSACDWQFSDGTNGSGAQLTGTNGAVGFNNMMMGRFSYTTAQSNITFQIQARGNGGSSILCDIRAAAEPLIIVVNRFPTSSELAYRPDVANWFVDASVGGANPSLGTSAQTAYVGIENGSLSLTQNTGSITTWIPCTGTNDASGTTCAAGNESAGVSFYAPAGTVRACASFSHNIQLTAAATLETTFQIVETPNTAQTISQEGKSKVESGLFGASAVNATHPTEVCGTFVFTSSGRKTLRLMYEQTVSGVINANQLLADNSSVNGQRDIHWEVYPVNQSMPAPVLVGSVTSNSTGAERVERVRVTNSGSCAIASQSGSWVSSVSRPATGRCAVNFTAGMFSGAPTCVATRELGAGGVYCMINGAPTTSATEVYCTTGAADTDSTFNLICMGPR